MTRIPASTYRVQLTPSFGFRDAAAIVPYLHELGVGDLYVSPILTARTGSEHGYDVVDPTRLSEQLGGREGFDELVAALRARDMGLLVDIVPNHMATGAENAWWMDLLEGGLASRAAAIFDIDRESVARDGLLVPILGAPYADVLAAGELSLDLDGGALVVRYADHMVPIHPATYPMVLAHAIDRVRDDALVAELRALIDVAERLPSDPRKRARAAAALKERLASGPAVTHVRRVLRAFRDPVLLDALLSRQPYVLAHWRLANSEPNYRRFFDITDLAAVRVHDPKVFAETHALLLDLARAGAITGLRVDHVDGLRDPAGYLAMLRDATYDTAAEYVVVEKILSGDEPLPAWRTDGTTGYEFLNDVNGLFVDPNGIEALDAAWRRATGRTETFDELLAAAKRHVLEALFAGEIESLVRATKTLARLDPRGRDLSSASIRAAFVELTAALDVYRTYITATEVRDEDRARIDRAVKKAAGECDDDERRALALLRDGLLLELGADGWIDVAARWQQLSGPAMAKGFEDTTLYRATRLLAANDVGGHPDAPAVSVEEFHRRMSARAHLQSLNATATHDTKRGEDVRARLDVLTEMPDEFARAFARWQRTPRVDPPIHPADAWVFYQTVLGVWPADGSVDDALPQRLKDYMTKALREGKERSGWLDPDEEYEGRAHRYVDAAMADEGFRVDVSRLVRRIAFTGAIGSLAQALIKTCAPGVPDFYQGTERWQLVLVDPDNRSAVAFDENRRLLGEIQGASPESLLRAWPDGRVKLGVTAKALRFRRDHPGLFRDGDYLPLTVRGDARDHVIAFARVHGDERAIVIAPRLVAAWTKGGRAPLGDDVWRSTSIAVPTGSPARWRNVLTDEEVAARRGSLRVGEALARFPVALLAAERA